MRSEIKYLIAESERARLHERLAPFVRSDAHATVRDQARTSGDPIAGDIPGYTVRSMYFDTPDLRDYHQKESGDLQRRKLRIRGYGEPTSERSGDTPPLFLEVKLKHEQAVWKTRARMTSSEAWALLQGDLDMEALPAAQRDAARYFLYRLRRERRRPTLLVTYDREPLVGRFDPSLRVTFDRHLRCQSYPAPTPDFASLYVEEGLRPVLPGHFILEVKFDRLYPSWLRPILGTMGLGRQALSKYAMGFALAAGRKRWRFGASATSALSAAPALTAFPRPR